MGRPKSDIIQCHKCHKEFRVEELVSYCTAMAKKPNNYCPKCLEWVQEDERFRMEVCRVFGLKGPGVGPQINRERDKLMTEYGYTMDTITECLRYVYDIKKIIPIKATLYFVTPIMIDEMNKYKRMQKAEGNSLAQAMNITTITEHIVPEKKEVKETKPKFDFDSFFDD